MDIESCLIRVHQNVLRPTTFRGPKRLIGRHMLMNYAFTYKYTYIYNMQSKKYVKNLYDNINIL